MKLRILVAAVLLAACSGGERWGSPDAAGPSDEEPRRGGWDANSGNFNGNIGLWQLVGGIGADPPWAPGGTGKGTLTNAMIYGLRPQATSSPTCEPTTAGVTAVNFLSSTGSTAAATGPDVEVVRAGGPARLAMNEQVVFAGLAFDGYGHSIEATFSVTRVDTLVRALSPWYEWPVFALEICENDRPNRGYVHLGYVSWAPMMKLPELPGESFTFYSDIVMPVTTVARPEYAMDAAVPATVKRQTGALWFKFAFYSSLPIALHGESALAITTSAGATIPNQVFLRDGASSLGNMSWVHTPAEFGLPADQRHLFQAYFTRDGTEVAMFAVARGNGVQHAAIHYPAAWGGGVVSALELTPAELDPEVSWQLDACHGVVDEARMDARDRWAIAPTHIAAGLSTYRVGRFLNSSPNDWRYELYAQREVNIRRAHWETPIDGKVQSHDEVRRLAVPAAAQVDFVVCAESPLVPGKEDMGGSGGIIGLTGGPDAGVDASVIDAPIADAGGDAAMIDAPADAAMPDAPQPVDAGADAAQPDAPQPVDAGPDAMLPDAFVPIDAPDDADVDAPDAPDADTDATVDDAPGEGGGPADASCVVGCVDATDDAF